MVVTDYSLTNKDVLGMIPQINQLGLNNLCDSGRLKRKMVLGVWKYDKSSVNSLIKKLSVDKYLTYSETKEMLETNGIRDIFKRFSDKNETLKCRYVRVTNEFPMSVSNLIKYGYLDVDKDISPMMIKKESVVKTIKHFSSVKNNQRIQPSVSKPKTHKQPIQMFQSDDLGVKMLEKMVINIYDKLGYSMSEVDLQNLLDFEVETPTSPIQPTVTTNRIINQTELGKILNLPQKVIKFIKDENIISWKKDGKQTLFDEISIKEFQKSFNRDDYIHSTECSKKLQKWGFNGMYISIDNKDEKVKLLVSIGNLYKETNYELNGKKLKYIKFDTTVYIERKSFSQTLNWLRNLNKKYNIIPTKQQWEEMYQKLLTEKQKLKTYNIGKKIKLNAIQMSKRFGSHNIKLGMRV